jgi:uncharacterized protein with GYD domain
MATYLYQASYANESWATQLRERQNVLEWLRPLAAALKVEVKDAWYAFGDHDILVLAEAPDAEAAAAFALAVAAGASVRSLKTTCLLSVAQGQEAMKRASKAASSYHAPVN